MIAASELDFVFDLDRCCTATFEQRLSRRPSGDLPETWGDLISGRSDDLSRPCPPIVLTFSCSYITPSCLNVFKSYVLHVLYLVFNSDGFASGQFLCKYADKCCSSFVGCAEYFQPNLAPAYGPGHLATRVCVAQRRQRITDCGKRVVFVLRSRSWVCGHT